MESNSLMIGKEYLITHIRKGKFHAIVKGFNSDWVTIEITKGKAGAALECNERHPGEEMTVRKGFCRFTEVQTVNAA